MKMTSNALLLYLLATFSLTAMVQQDSPDKVTLPKPNIVLILADDLGWADVGYNGATYHQTPNLDRLAEQSMVFDRSYSRPTCSPSRASLFTGLNAAHTKIYHVKQYYGVPRSKWKVTPPVSGHHYEKKITMLGDAMKAAGYITGYASKWHVTKNPKNNGFDFNAGGWSKGSPASYFSPYENPMLKDGPKGEYLSARLANESIGFIKKNKAKPFFLCYAPYLVHYPTQAPKTISSVSRAERKRISASRQCMQPWFMHSTEP